MKKNGFTLAEVLITLAIIGVVASLTLPALMTNTGEQQAKAAFKKGINTLTEAAKMNETLLGWDFAGATADNTAAQLTATDQATKELPSFMNLLRQRTSIDMGMTGSSADKGKLKNAAATSYFTIVFQDGTALMFPKARKATTANAAIQDDGLPLGFAAVYDTNGFKAPNQLSNCKGTQIGQVFNEAVATTNDEKADDAGLKKCEDPKKRVIKDQFEIRVRGSVVQPRGAAATWAYNN